MPHQYEYKMLTHYSWDKAPKGAIEIGEVLEDYAETLADKIAALPGKFEWEVVSHCISFLNGHPLVTILLRHR